MYIYKTTYVYINTYVYVYNDDLLPTNRPGNTSIRSLHTRKVPAKNIKAHSINKLHERSRPVNTPIRNPPAKNWSRFPRGTCARDRVMSRIKEYCHTWRSHVTSWVMSNFKESWHTWGSHVTNEGVMSAQVSSANYGVMLCMIENCYTWRSHVTHKAVMSHMKKSCPHMFEVSVTESCYA